MAEQLTLLCSLIIEDLYGALPAQIFLQLATHGRLAQSQIAERCRLPKKQVLTGLAALVQLRLVYHNTSNDGVSNYQANKQTAYKLLRIGKLVNLTRTRYGLVAAAIVEELALLGFATLPDLQYHMVTNHHSGQARSSKVDLRNISFERAGAILEKLVEDGFIHQIHRAHFQERHDARQDARKKLGSSATTVTPKPTKAQQEADMKVSALLKEDLDPRLSAQELRQELNISQSETNGHTYNSDQPSKLLLTVNFSKVVQALRDREASTQIASLLGKKASKIVVAVLDDVGLDSDGFRDFDESSSKQEIDVVRLTFKLNERMDAPRWSNAEQVNGWHDAISKTNGTERRVVEVYEDEVDEQIRIIYEGPLNILQTSTINTGGWAIDPAELKKALRDQEIIRLISERIDPPGLRLIRMLKDKGKLDEKTLQELGLLGAKELRQTTAKLKAMGFLDLQEIPREPQRQPNRTIFLWFFDADRVQRVLLGELYQILARLYQRLHLERQRLASTLSKIERTDVQGSEEDILGPGELRVLQQWRRKETWLIGEIERLDDSVALLRDL